MEAGTTPLTLIRPARRSGLPDFRELWRSRDLAMILAWRDVKVRYKQSLIGIAWAVLQPFLTMVVFTVIFGKFAQLPSQGLPYPVFSMLNLVPWTFLAAVFTLTAGCVLSNRMLVQKVHFPLLILPLACILVPLVDFTFSFAVALGITSWYDVAIQSTVVLVPFFLLMLAMTAIGLGSFLAVINVRYRDVPLRCPVPRPALALRLWRHLRGGGDPREVHGRRVAEPCRRRRSQAFAGPSRAPRLRPPTMMVLGVTMTLVLFFCGLWFYRRAEHRFADTI